ncbi:dihydroorotase [Fulvivirgaceae bacterium BMA10]|uniref:Dihydroorotase n=1 Tax=Splendidivirga corallicola TaxID=3051826 RepID=A0ABT8KMB0_9BACT|nr:dihydroorotase [Fulvivirgaceae bacterium BMA10]
MEILLESVEIVDKRYPFNGNRRNILIKDGYIKSITNKKISAKKVIDCRNVQLSTGWFDLGTFFGDPGFEYKEDIASGCATAMYGGFTDVAILPNTLPTVQSKNEITYLKSKCDPYLTEVHPLAAVTNKTEGKELTEMIDLFEAGAVGFTDGLKPLWNTDIVLKTLQYLQKFDGLLINRPEDTMLTAFGSMHEGVQSTGLGLKGMPSLAEEVMIARDIQLLEYAGGKIHFHNISSGNSVELIRKAKKKGLAVSCDIGIHQIAFDDSKLEDFDTVYKVNPPFREKKDVKQLVKGLKDGTIDLIVSSHRPQDEESKNLEFDLADFGITGLQTFYPVLLEYLNEISLEDLIEKVTINPRELLNLPLPEIKEDALACLTLFQPSEDWTLNDTTNKSKSKNSPFYGQKLKGKVVGAFNKGKYFLDPSISSQ